MTKCVYCTEDECKEKTTIECIGIKWAKGKDKLKRVLSSKEESEFENYGDLFKIVLEVIFHDIKFTQGVKPSPIYIDSIKTVYTRRYSGDLFMFFTFGNFIENIAFTHVSYGSCSGCDALESARFRISYNEKEREKGLEELMQLCLHLVQKIKLFFYEGEFVNVQNK